MYVCNGVCAVKLPYICIMTKHKLKPNLYILISTNHSNFYLVNVKHQLLIIQISECESTYKIDHEHSNIDTRLNQDNSALCFHNGREVLESFGYDTVCK